jgi:cystathionine gamma-synthase
MGLDGQGQNCFIYPSHQAATDCIAFATSPRRGDETIPQDKIHLRIFKTPASPVFALTFPAQFTGPVYSFWLNAGTGISSRLAEDTLKHFDAIEEVKPDVKPGNAQDSTAHTTIKQRIVDLLHRAPTGATLTAKVKVSPDDVYFFTTGMASIYWVHRILLSKFNSLSVLFGFSFHSTIHVLEDHGPGVEFFGRGDDGDLEKLVSHLSTQKQKGTKVQALYVEFPSNPLLNVPDLVRLRQLCDEYEAFLIVDDTVGSFANVDVLSVADIIITSLTKSFSGYADVMAGCAVLSPLSAHYSDLKALFTNEYHNDLYVGDAIQLEQNSRDYLARSAKLNANAEALVAYLQTKAEDPNSTVTKVWYPTTSPTFKHYKPFMRTPTPEFPSPGYGCLFSIEFQDTPSTIAFYDNLHVHKGPHLGAHLTIALPYTMGIYGNELAKIAQYDMVEAQIRISVGLEDSSMLLDVFKYAVEFADREQGRPKN